MSKYIVMEPVEHIKCDFCSGNTEEMSGYSMDICSLCGKDVCGRMHNGMYCEACEDGILCPDCSEIYEFDYDGGGVGVVERKTGKVIEAKYL